MNKLFLLIAWCLISLPAEAKFILTASQIYSQYNNKNLKIPSQMTNSISYGYLEKFNKISISASSNRLIQSENKIFIKNKKNDQQITLKSKYTIDTFNIGYQIHKHIVGITLANVKALRKINEHKTVNHAILYGLNYSFIFKKNVLLTLTLIAPNKELSLKGAGIAGINFLF